MWDDADLAVVVDAVRSGAAPGTVHVVELGVGDDGGAAHLRTGATSTHGIGLAGVFRLARAVGHAPGRVVVVGIEGQDFGRGEGLSAPVKAALPGAVDTVLELIREAEACA